MPNIYIRKLVLREIQVEFYLPLITIGLIHLYLIKKLNIVKNSIVPESGELKMVILSTVSLVVVWLVIMWAKHDFKFPNMLDYNNIWIVFSEELVFRTYLVGLALSNVSFSRNFLCYSLPSEDKALFTFFVILVIGVFFSNLHFDWTLNPAKLFIRAYSGFVYGISYVLTNRKIYAPMLFHYINNVYATT